RQRPAQDTVTQTVRRRLWPSVFQFPECFVVAVPPGRGGVLLFVKSPGRDTDDQLAAGGEDFVPTSDRGDGVDDVFEEVGRVHRLVTVIGDPLQLLFVPVGENYVPSTHGEVGE